MENTIIDKLKDKKIEDITLIEKFELIQYRMKGISVDYKSPWWLDGIFDEYLSNNPNINYIETTQQKGMVEVTISLSNVVASYYYTSTLDKRTRHDAMLNVLTLYFIDNE